jgi:hypothetical protein
MMRALRVAVMNVGAIVWGMSTMVRFRKTDPAVFEKPAKRPAGRQPSPEQLALIARIKTITDPSIVYEVILDSDEKPITVRQQLLRASKAADVPVVIRKAERGFYVGLETPGRKSRRGRKPAA